MKYYSLVAFKKYYILKNRSSHARAVLGFWHGEEDSGSATNSSGWEDCSIFCFTIFIVSCLPWILQYWRSCMQT